MRAHAAVRRTRGDDVEVERMAKDSESAFRQYLENAFPIDGKRTRSAVIRQALAEKIASYLKGSAQNSDKIFRHFVKKSGFELLDLPSVGIRDALVVRVKEEHKVKCGDRACNKSSVKV